MTESDTKIDEIEEKPPVSDDQLVDQPDPIPDPEEHVDPVVEEPQAPVQHAPEDENPAPEPEEKIASLPEASAIGGGFASQDFEAFVSDKLLSFLSIMDIEHPGQRRNAIIAHNLSEEKIRERLALADAFLTLERAYASEHGRPDMVEHADEFSAKLVAMKQWLTI